MTLDAKAAVMSTPTDPSPTRPARRWRALTLALLAVGAMTGPAFLSSGPASAAPAPPARCQVIDFRTATVDPLVSSGPSATTHRLTVTGLLPEPATVSLVPLTYVRQPEHWEIEVQACPIARTVTSSMAGEPVPPVRLYRATLDFHGTLGSCGIDVVGATMHQTFDLAGPRGCAAFGGHS
jgi:hypothetical protein